MSLGHVPGSLEEKGPPFCSAWVCCPPATFQASDMAQGLGPTVGLPRARCLLPRLK